MINALPQFLFLAVSAIVMFFALKFVALTKGITFFGRGTDNEKQVLAAAQSDQWKWPSDMHKYGQEKTRMKDVTVLCLAWMQKFLKDKKSDHALVALCGVCNAISAVLIFLAAYTYWGWLSATVIFVLFVTCFWPWQIALIGGHICVAQVFFLLSILCIQQAAGSVYPGFAFALSGMFFGLSQFASASARKFIPLVIAAFLYSQRMDYSALLAGSGLMLSRMQVAAGQVWPLVLIFGLGVLFIRLAYRPLIRRLYAGNGPAGLNKYIRNQAQYSLEDYFRRARKFIHAFEFLAVILAGYCYFYLVFLGPRSFFAAQVPLWIGFGIVGVGLLLPDVFSNLKGYFDYFHIGQKYCHFVCYEDYFARIGKPIKKDMRGAGWIWVLKLAGRVIPFIAFFYMIGIVFLLFSVPFKTGMIFLLLSGLPVFWAEMTHAPQISRSYFPMLYGLFIVIGFGLGQLPVQNISFVLLSLFCLAGAAWNFKVFFEDVYPARMNAAWLLKSLKKLGITKIYTYNSDFNMHFLHAISPDDLEGIEVKYVDSVTQSGEDGAVVLPGSSARAINMEATGPGRDDQDFRSDQVINELIDSREIERIAAVKLKTYGTSRIWVNEGEPTTYRELILKEISAQDRWRSFGWIVTCKSLHEYLKTKTHFQTT